MTTYTVMKIVGMVVYSGCIWYIMYITVVYSIQLYIVYFSDEFMPHEHTL